MQLKAVYTACKLNNDQMTESTNVHTVYVQQVPLFFLPKRVFALLTVHSLCERGQRDFLTKVIFEHTLKLKLCEDL